MKKCLTSDEFVKKSQLIHGFKYDYSLAEYKNRNTKIKIICPIHGLFEQTPNNHMKRYGCYHCGIEQRSKQKRLTQEEFITKAYSIHGTKYNYILVNYINSKTPVQIICYKHGIFKQIANHHLSGSGCPQCSKNGFKPFQSAVLYVLTDNEKYPTLLKIGVTNNFKQRLMQLRRHTPYKIFDLITYHFLNGADAYKIEQEIHYLFQELNAGFSNFKGATEWFNYSPEILDHIRSSM